MTDDEFLKPLAGPLRDLTRWLNDSKVPFAVIGGVAAGLLGKYRATGDVDAVILTDESKIDIFVEDAKSYGFVPRMENAVEFARENRVLLLRHVGDDIGVDLSLGILPFETEMIARAIRVQAVGVEIPIAPPEELIVMKALAFRPRDITDIETLLDANEHVDLHRVRNSVQELSDALEDPEIAARLERLLAMRHATRSPKKKK